MPSLLRAPMRAEAWSCERSHGASPPEQRWEIASRPTKSLLGIRGVMAPFSSGRPGFPGGRARRVKQRFRSVGIDGAVWTKEEPAPLHLRDRLPRPAGQRFAGGRGVAGLAGV